MSVVFQVDPAELRRRAEVHAQAIDQIVAARADNERMTSEAQTLGPLYHQVKASVNDVAGQARRRRWPASSNATSRCVMPCWPRRQSTSGSRAENRARPDDQPVRYVGGLVLESAQQTTVEVFEATSRDETIIVSVDRQGASIGVQLEPEAMDCRRRGAGGADHPTEHAGLPAIATGTALGDGTQSCGECGLVSAYRGPGGGVRDDHRLLAGAQMREQWRRPGT